MSVYERKRERKYGEQYLHIRKSRFVCEREREREREMIGVRSENKLVLEGEINQ